jgi:hypothetical protein
MPEINIMQNRRKMNKWGMITPQNLKEGHISSNKLYLLI